MVYTLRGRIPYKFLQVIPLWTYIFTSSTYSLHFPLYVLQVLFFEEIKGEIVKSHLFEMWLNFFILCISYQGGVWLSKILQGFYYQGGVLVFYPRGIVVFHFQIFYFYNLLVNILLASRFKNEDYKFISCLCLRFHHISNKRTLKCFLQKGGDC